MPLTRSNDLMHQLITGLRDRPPTMPSGYPAGSTASPATADTDNDYTAAAAGHDGPADWAAPPQRDQILTSGQIRAVIVASYAAYSRDWPATIHRGSELVILMAAYQVVRFRSGVYPVPFPGTTPLRPLPGDGLLPRLRQQYADAPALLLVCGDVSAACESTGSAGYGSLLVRAGALAQAAAMSAATTGLTASTYGRPCRHTSEATKAAIGGNPRHLVTISLGLPARASA